MGKEERTTASDSPRELSNAPHLIFARRPQRGPVAWARNNLDALWRTAGGGFYGLGYVVTFIVLEITLLFSELFGEEGITGIITDGILRRLLGFGLDSLGNMIHALLWPIAVIQEFGGWGVLLLLAGHQIYTRFVHTHLINALGDPKDEAREHKARKKAMKEKVIRHKEAQKRARKTRRG